MQKQSQDLGAEKATTPRYDTIVIRGAQGASIPKEVDGGEVIAWSRGHDLAAIFALEEFVEDLAAGDSSYPDSLTRRAQTAIALMRRRRDHGWDEEIIAEGGWSKEKPCVPGAYWVRGFRLLASEPGLPALVDVRLDGDDLVTNIHMNNSDQSLRQWELVSVLSSEFEWLGPLQPALPSDDVELTEVQP